MLVEFKSIIQMIKKRFVGAIALAFLMFRAVWSAVATHILPSFHTTTARLSPPKKLVGPWFESPKIGAT